MDAACTQASVAPCFAHCAGDSTVYMYTSFRSHTWFVIGSSLPTSKRFRATVALKSRVTRGHQPGGFSLPQDLLTTTIFQCNVSVPNKANVGSPCARGGTGVMHRHAVLLTAAIAIAVLLETSDAAQAMPPTIAASFSAGRDTVLTSHGAPHCPSCLVNGLAAPDPRDAAAWKSWFQQQQETGRVLSPRRLQGYDVIFALSNSLSSGSTTSLQSVTLTIGFTTGSVTGFQATDFSLTGCSISSLVGSGNIYYAQLELNARDVLVLLPAGVVDPAPSNEANALTLTYRAFCLALARMVLLNLNSPALVTEPSVTLSASHSLWNGGYTSLDTFSITATFGSDVANVQITDFAVSGADVDDFTQVSNVVYVDTQPVIGQVCAD